MPPQAGGCIGRPAATIFRINPWEHEACRRLPTKPEKQDYRLWIDRFAQALGNTPTAIILQPDGPFALCAPGGSRLPSDLVKYAAQKFAALPNSHVYIDAGAADWPKDNPAEAAEILVRAGVDQVRGPGGVLVSDRGPVRPAPHHTA